MSAPSAASVGPPAGAVHDLPAGGDFSPRVVPPAGGHHDDTAERRAAYDDRCARALLHLEAAAQAQSQADRAYGAGLNDDVDEGTLDDLRLRKALTACAVPVYRQHLDALLDEALRETGRPR